MIRFSAVTSTVLPGRCDFQPWQLGFYCCAEDEKGWRRRETGREEDKLRHGWSFVLMAEGEDKEGLGQTEEVDHICLVAKPLPWLISVARSACYSSLAGGPAKLLIQLWALLRRNSLTRPVVPGQKAFIRVRDSDGPGIQTSKPLPKQPDPNYLRRGNSQAQPQIRSGGMGTWGFAFVAILGSRSAQRTRLIKIPLPRPCRGFSSNTSSHQPQNMVGQHLTLQATDILAPSHGFSFCIPDPNISLIPQPRLV